MERVADIIEPLARKLMELDDKKGVYAVLIQGNKNKPLKDSVEWMWSTGDYDDCDQIAMDKAEVSWRTGKSTRDAGRFSDMLGEHNDCAWYGSVVTTIDEIRQVVAVSGLTAVHDEYLAAIIMHTIDMVAGEMVTAAINGNGRLP